MKMLEPLTVFKMLPKAKSKLVAVPHIAPKLKYEEPFIRKSLDDLLAIKTNRSPLPKLDHPKSVRSPLLRIDQKELSMTLKKEVLKFPSGEFAQGVEVAEVLEDVLRKVERKVLGLPEKRSQFINRALEEKMRLKEIEEKEKKERDRRLFERSKQAKYELEEFQKRGGLLGASRIRQSYTEPTVDHEKEMARLQHVQRIKEKVRYHQFQKEQDELATKAEERRRIHHEREEKKQRFQEWHEQKLERIVTFHFIQSCS